MKSNLSRPIWPYMSVLCLLFVLAMTAPRSWHASARVKSAGAVRHWPVDGRVRPLAEDRVTPVSVASAPQAEVPAPPTLPALPEAFPAPEALSSPAPEPAPMPVVETVEQPISFPTPEPTPVVERPVHTILPGGLLIELADNEPEHVAEPAEFDAQKWAEPRLLRESLARLAEGKATRNWSEKTSHILGELLKSPHDSASREMDLNRLRDLRTLADQVDAIATSVSDPKLRSELLRARYALSRRLDFYAAAVEDRAAETAPSNAGVELQRQIDELAQETGDSDAGAAWHDYLKLAELRASLAHGDASSQDDNRRLGRSVLDRLALAKSTSNTRAYVGQPCFADFDRALRRWMAEPVAANDLIRAIEAYEIDSNDVAARRIFEFHETLAASTTPDDLRLASSLRANYRNANLRIAVTAELLNRWLPDEEISAAPVRDNVLGAQVSGRSRTRTALSVRLIPSRDSLRIALEASGRVFTNTAAQSGPAIFYSNGRSTFVAEKEFAIGQEGIRFQPAVAHARSHSNLVSVGTDYDDVPLLRSFVRNIARSQHEESQEEALDVTEHKVAATARQRLDADAEERIRKLEADVRSRLWGPLGKLDIPAKPIELTTTEERAVARLRIADGRQLGAHTPRPQAPSDSLASFQIHESALNNMLDRFELEGRTFELHELYTYLAKKLDRQPNIPEDLPENVHVTFAKHEPIQVRGEEGRVKVVLSLAKLDSPEDDFRNLRVMAFYKPQSQGMHAELVRDGSIRLDGDRLNTRSQIVLRGVFAKVFSRATPVQIIDAARAREPRLAKLRISEFVVDDGWIGLAIADNTPKYDPHVARQPLPLRRD